MEALVCKCCGSNELRRENEYWHCVYCDSKFLVTEEQSRFIGSAGKNTSWTNSHIELSSDVEKLLHKCKTDPKNARKYANLILDMDPDNIEALKFLK